MHKRFEPLRESQLKLAQIENAYNAVRQKTLTVEYPLIADEVEAFDTELAPALKSMNWENVDSAFIDNLQSKISTIQSRVVKAQENLKQVEQLASQWRSAPLYQGKERKFDCLIPLEEREALREARFKEIDTAAAKIDELIKDNLELFKADEGSSDWAAYLEAAEDMILGGLIEAVRCSLAYLSSRTERSKTEIPLMETKLNLVENRLVYTPGVQDNQGENLLDLVDSLIQDITNQSRLIPSLLHPQKPTLTSETSAEKTEPSSDTSTTQRIKNLVGFSQQVLNTTEISEFVKKITEHVRAAMRAAAEFQTNLETSYSVYWAEDRTEFIRQFCRYGRLLTKDDLSPTGEIEAPENPPTLEQFREQILKYDRVYEEVEHLPDTHIFDSWLRADLKPFKNSLLTVIRQWSDKFKQYLVDHVTSTLDNLKVFIEDSTNDMEIKGDPEQVDYDSLVRVLERLKLIREAEDATDAGFEPLRETVALLKEFGEELPTSMNKLLESLPDQWHELKNVAVLTKQKIQPLQEREVQNIRALSAHYDAESARLRKEFSESDVFDFECPQPYESLDEWNARLAEVEKGVAEMQVSAKSFEVRDIPTYMDLKAMRREMKVTKRVWDYINMFRSYVTAWKTSRWKEIDFGSIDEVIREISLEIRTMDKDVKQWPMFQGLEAELKDINASVTAVRDLQNPAVKDRHWIELMADTGRTIDVNDETTLADLLSLNLHKFEEEVHGIVSKASNEQKIERDLEKIEQVWSEMMFEYETHDRTGMQLPKQTEQLTTTLEEIQVKVLDMLGNRDNSFYIDRINYWHKTLSTSDQVLSVWFETQRIWSGLESIFMLCDDIKSQLPEDTAMFMDLDKEFRVLIEELQSKPKVLDATTERPEMLDEIQKILDGLAVCEKALADYLETKRLSFPRFYFVSQVDVTDIVSNGKVPAKVLRHLSKLFDSICSLTFAEPNAEVAHATKMVAKDGEEVKFVKSFDLQGQVEEWLNLLLDEMRHTLRKVLAEAVAAYEEKPRDQWIFDYPAQIALTGSQIGWNSEVQIAFGRLEEGLENAMKEYNKKQISQLGILIQMLLTDLTPGDRQKIMTLCTVDVHNRDIVGKLISQKVENSQAFTWLSQLRHRWDDAKQNCYANICDAQFAYAYEYLGNTPRLVITPLTDRCYITLTQSLHLCMSGAPAGPAGTGKTETTKDLGRALGVMVYVFNCSEQMDYMSVGNIYKGLAQAGAWGCFDEFNRIAVEVLSVVAVQVSLFSVIMRDLANMTGPDPKWIVLDGDIDPMWIESLNTVMDDNKVLTLASNERIPLTNSMRLLFEISHLKTATPATVSRAGILYVNPGDLGWTPYVHSWLDERVRQKKTLSRTERPALSICFDKYVSPSLEILKTKLKRVTPIPDIAHVEMLCHLLECMLDAQKALKDNRDFTKENYEMLFVFCSVWAFGGSLFKDQLADYRIEFSKWWLNEFKQVKFPSTGGVFDFFWNLNTRKFESWSTRLSKCELDPEIPLEASLVPTVEVARLRFFLDLLIEAGRPVMLVGSAGTGKSVIMQDKFTSLSDEFIVKNIPFNFYTTSLMLQEVLDKSLEKKAGINYGPPGQKRLIYFIDDLNMPEVDQYFTVQPHTLIRQHIDYGHFYDRQKLTLKRVQKTQYVAAMNPTAGSFTITPRLQRHFSVFALSFPDEAAVKTIYATVLKQHFVRNNFPMVVVRSVDTLVDACLAAHMKITSVFLPTAVKFHYVFNLRDLTNIFQCLLFSQPEVCNSVLSMVRLYRHEAIRVYTDKMIDVADVEAALKHVTAAISVQFPELHSADITAEPLMYCSFNKGLSAERQYCAVPSVDQINKVVIDALNAYNDTYAMMDLVLFSDAVAHVLRICRILEMPRGSALLIGIGGSGKQSLSRLAAFMSGFEVSQIVLRKGYSQQDLRAHLAQLYLKASLKNMPYVFLMTDAQVADERFLVYVNDFLASGEIPNLFAEEELDQIITSIRPEVKSIGLMDTVENCWQFFIDKTRKMLRVILCFSPVGDKLRVRARRFPALVNRTCIDWFHEWPQEALLSVSERFLTDCPGLSDEVRPSVSRYMAYVHTTVNELSREYLEKERRHNYTTPKSFLEQISLYKRMVGDQIEELQQKIDRLVNGLERLKEAGEQTSELKVQLAEQEVVVKEKSENAKKLIAVVGQETEKVSAEKEIAAEEEAKVSVIKAEVTLKQRDCEEDLRKAEPALIAAQEALNTLNKNNLTELKALTNPPPDVVLVCSAVMCLFAMDGKLPKDRSWRAAKAGIMSKVDQFLYNLLHYDKENIHQNSKQAALEYVKMPNFDPEVIRTKSSAAAGLCSWVINILKFYEVYLEVKPKRDALDAANEELRQATEKLETLQKKIAVLEASLAELTANFREATEEKLRCQQEVDFTAKTLDLANRLVSGFASENVRWAQQVEVLRKLGETVIGDVLVTTTFISYFGYLSKPFRQQLLDKRLWTFMKRLNVPIPIRDGIDPLYMLVDDAIIATWNNQALPEDRMSVENAAIFSFCERWPLCVDPQLQAIKWIKVKYGSDLVVTRLGAKNYLDQIERAISDGSVVLIENIGETVDPILDPIIGRQTIKKGSAIKMGDREIPYNPNFRLLLQTKLANPHYQPELQAQTTLINFTVTRDGLEDQLLAVVVSKERPDLERLKSDLTKQQNEFKITLKNLEDSLLAKLATSSGNFLGDHSLVENLETNKKTAKDIEEKVAEAKVTEREINQAREHYRNAAARAALIYFVMNDLCHIHPMYQFSLKAFRTVFEHAIDTAPEAETEKERLASLLDNITYSIFVYTTRGLFEKDKLIFLVLMVLQVQIASKELSPVLMDFLLRYPVVPDVKSPVDFLSDLNWGGVQTLVKMSNFRDLDKDIVASAKRWKAFLETEAPEKEKFPQEWKNKSAAEKLCMMRALRHDRMTYALRHYIGTTFGMKYVEARQVEFAKSFKESNSAVPIFFILSPGVDPLKDVEVLGRKLGFTLDQGNFHNISLGQGQEVVAEAALETAAREGHWVVLQNIHLVARWLSTLEKRLEQYSETAHSHYRVFISAEPAGDPAAHIIPQGILENSIKITNEPPTGMHANLHKALDNFTQETLERCTKEAEFKPILFALCYFHAVVTERSKFGAQGWNRTYPFNVGDLCICLDVLYNYLEANSKVPWEDLRYLFGEIMYGGHITDDWDRRLCRTFLQEYLQPDLVDGDLYLAPNFLVPPNSDYVGYHDYIDKNLPPESPYLYGLHPNAEIDFLTKASERIFRVVLELQPRDAGADVGDTPSREETLNNLLEDLLDRLPDGFPMSELYARQAPEERSPYAVVVLQECERMNLLVDEMRRSLKELRLGLRGELTVSAAMELLINALFLDQVPASWERYAYPSLYPLGLWFADMLNRVKDLEIWSQDLGLPGSVWIGGLFNPQSFLTAVMQQTARKMEWPLDKICISVEVTKKTKEEMGSAPREGAHVHGLFMEGARWDPGAGCMVDARIKELAPPMPVMLLRAVPSDRQEGRVAAMYACPVYKTKLRGPTFVWTFHLKTKEKPAKWILGGVALLLQV
ncbi:unnamed protein product [Dicrocoelium dendriticum]|nr:unnamed protein product [Dicrocoelium dendriticum]